MELSKDDFNMISKLVLERSGMVLEPGKEYLVISRLLELAQRLGKANAADLLSEFRASRGQTHASLIVDALTINETYFFRDGHPFDALQQHVLPELIKRNETKRELNIWCCAASSGQEPCSIMMLLQEHYPKLLDWRLNFLATDISERMLERCRNGVYSQLEVNRGLPAKLLIKYFKNNSGKYQFKPELIKRVTYKPLNLTGLWNLGMRFDLIFIRNVLIYFDSQTKTTILNRLKNQMEPQGYLFLGASENIMHPNSGFTRTQIGTSWCFRQESKTAVLPELVRK